MEASGLLGIRRRIALKDDSQDRQPDHILPQAMPSVGSERTAFGRETNNRRIVACQGPEPGHSSLCFALASRVVREERFVHQEQMKIDQVYL